MITIVDWQLFLSVFDIVTSMIPDFKTLRIIPVRTKKAG